MKKIFVFIIILIIISCEHHDVYDMTKHHLKHCNKVDGIHFSIHGKQLQVDYRDAHLPSYRYVNIDCITDNNYIIYVNIWEFTSLYYDIFNKDFKDLLIENNITTPIKIVLFIENEHILESIEIETFFKN